MNEYIMNIEMEFFGYLYITDLINARKVEHIETYITFLNSPPVSVNCSLVRSG